MTVYVQGDNTEHSCNMAFSFPLLTVPMAIFLAYVPHALKVRIAKRSGKYNNKDPRATAKMAELPAEKAALLTRLLGAHQNQLELLGTYAGGIVANVARGKDDWQLVILSGLYIALRCGYIVIYAGPQVVGGYLRTLIFMVILSLVFGIWIKAAV